MGWTFYSSSGQKLSSKGKVPVSDLADGTDGELITWGTDAAPTTVAAGTSGYVLTSGGADAVPSFQAAAGGGGGAVIRKGGQTSEATTTGTSEADLLSATSMSIGTTLPIKYQYIFRKTSGAASNAFVGLKVNATSIALANNFPMGRTSTTNQAESRHASGTLGPRIANYLHAGEFFSSGTSDGAGSTGRGGMGSADMPAATITDLVIRGVTYNSANTLGADELHVYSFAVS